MLDNMGDVCIGTEFLLSTEQVARRIRRSTQRVYQLDEELRPEFIGSTRVYRSSNVDRYLATRDAAAHAKRGRK